MKKGSFILVSFFSGLLCVSPIFAGFTNSGTMRTQHLNIACDDLQNDGTLEGIETADITTKVLAGSGLIQSKKVTIKCDEFKFNGGISAEECTIYAKKAFDYTMFTRNPEGKYTIVIAKYGFKSHTYKTLFSSAVATFTKNYLSLTKENIEHELKKIRSHAVLNKIDGIQLLEDIKKDLEAKITYNKERQHEKYGPSSELQKGIKWGSAGAIVLSMTMAAFLYHDSFVENYDFDSIPYQIASMAVVASGYSFFTAYKVLSNWLHPQYKEKYETLSPIPAAIDQSLNTPRISEEEIIVLQ